MSMRDRLLGSTIRFRFTTTDGSAPVSPVGLTVAVFKDGGTTPITAGVTLTVDHGGATGLQLVTVDTGADATAYSADSEFFAQITAGTAGGTSIAGYVVGEFSLGVIEDMLVPIIDDTQEILDLLGSLPDAAAFKALVVEALAVDLYAEPPQGALPSNASLAAKISRLDKLALNRIVSDGTAGEVRLYNSAGNVVDQKAPFSGNNDQVDRQRFVGGP